MKYEWERRKILQIFLYEYPNRRYLLGTLGAARRKLLYVGSEYVGWIHLAHGRETVVVSYKHCCEIRI
jgi:hypothetical protein